MPEDKTVSEQGSGTEQDYYLVMAKGSTEPYKSEDGAKSQMTVKKLKGKVIPHEGGWAIRVEGAKTKAETNIKSIDQHVAEPMAEESAETVLCPKCGHKSDTHKIGDPCIVRIDGKLCTAFYGQDVTQHKETFHWVTFGNKINDHDTIDVILAVNTEILQIQRGHKVCIPGRYREAAVNGITVKYETDPDTDRKIYAPVSTYPFSDHGEGTYKEFLDQYTPGSVRATAKIQSAPVAV